MQIPKADLWQSVFLSCGILASACANAAAQQTVLPERIKNALAHFKSLTTLSVSWTEQLQLTALGRTELGGRSTPAAPDVRYLVWQKGKLYTRRIEGGGQEWKEATNALRDEFAFDGRILASGSPDRLANGKPRNPRQVISLAEDRDPDADYFGVDSFGPMGLHLPHGARELLGMKPLMSQVLFLVEGKCELQEIVQAIIDGHPVTRISMLADNPM